MLNKIANVLSQSARKRWLRKHGLLGADAISTATTSAERDLLFQLAIRKKAGVGVEIGSAEGASSCFLAAGLGPQGKLYCVDKWNVEYRKEPEGTVSYMYDPDGTLLQYSWDNESKKIVFKPIGKYDEDCPTYKRFLAGTSQFRPPITAIRNESVDAASVVSEELDILFIDGWHEYEQVNKDTDAWLPKLKSGGIVIYHDYAWADGVQRVVKEDVMPRASERGSLSNLFWAVCR